MCSIISNSTYLDSEGEVLVVGVVDEHPLVGELLHALGLVVFRAVRDQRARLPGVEALLHSAEIVSII